MLPTEPLPIGFDLDWDTEDLSNDAWNLITDLKNKCELRELCPSPNMWHFVAKTEPAQRWISHLQQFKCIRLIYPDTNES